MSANLLLREFGRVAESTDAPDNLRRFVLDLAVRGKLVDQQAEDGTAKQLLKRLHEIAGNKSKSVDSEADYITADAKPFVLPATWEWCYVGQIGKIVGGGTPPASEPLNFMPGGTGIAWLTPADLGKHKGIEISHGIRDLSSRGMSECSATLMPRGSVLFSSRAPIGHVAIAANPISTNQGFKSVVPHIMEMSPYIAIYFRAFREAIDAQASGTTFREVSGKDVAALAFPLPPLAEQNRIVTQTNELLALCDQLEAVHAQREARRGDLRRVLVERLSSYASQDSAAHREIALLLSESHPLVTRPPHLVAVRRSIRAFAVQGRLVSHNPGDEPVTELLRRVDESRPNELRGKGGKLMAGAMQPDMDLVSLTVPETWEIVSLGRLITFGPKNGVSPRESKNGSDPKAVTLTATTSGMFDSTKYKHVEINIGPDSEHWLQPGDLIFQRGNTREYVGIAAYYEGEAGTFLYPDLMIKVRLSTKVSLAYVHLCTLAPYARSYMARRASGAQETMPKINQSILCRLPIPVPPYTEQLRIVSKIRELMGICDSLGEALESREFERRRFWTALSMTTLSKELAEITSTEKMS